MRIKSAEGVEGIYERAQILTTFPKIGRKYRTEPEGGIRILLYGHYRIAYLIFSRNRIDILFDWLGARAATENS